ncbi:dihydrodipicolinate reductase C-terminal domain-containing protein [Streptomyces sp. NPDC047737]|uniref:dihydrodipicolinate reductase C-terminal domain-containing protein n=1 Tax=unclassified Streptomyces TaxID=2593676 RepID=UPI0033D653ED
MVTLTQRDHRSGGPPRLGVVGAAGRLGSRVVQECDRHGLAVVWTATRTSWPARQDGDAAPTVVVDASRGDVLPRTADYCRSVGAALLVCASDIGPAQRRAAADLAAEVPVVLAANLSIVNWLQHQLVRTAAALSTRLPEAPDTSVLERHTTAKRDRPSATARSLAGAWQAAGAGLTHEIASYRAGLPVSEHRFALGFAHETLTITHDVRDLGPAALGALTAATWIHQGAPRLWTGTELFDEILLPDSSAGPRGSGSAR